MRTLSAITLAATIVTAADVTLPTAEASVQQQSKDEKRAARKEKRQTERADRPGTGGSAERRKPTNNPRSVAGDGGTGRTQIRRFDPRKNHEETRRVGRTPVLPTVTPSAERRALREAEYNARVETLRARREERERELAEAEGGSATSTASAEVGARPDAGTGSPVEAAPNAVVHVAVGDAEAELLVAELRKHRGREARLRRLLELSLRDHSRRVELERLRRLERLRHDEQVEAWKASWGEGGYRRAHSLAMKVR